MNETTEQTLKTFHDAIDKLVRCFETKQDFELEFWIADNKTGLAYFGDYCFTLDDIHTDMINNAPAGLIIKWHNDTTGYLQNAKYKRPTINYRSYIMGLRYEHLDKD